MPLTDLSTGSSRWKLQLIWGWFKLLQWDWRSSGESLLCARPLLKTGEMHTVRLSLSSTCNWGFPLEIHHSKETESKLGWLLCLWFYIQKDWAVTIDGWQTSAKAGNPPLTLFLPLLSFSPLSLLCNILNILRPLGVAAVRGEANAPTPTPIMRAPAYTGLLLPNTWRKKKLTERVGSLPSPLNGIFPWLGFLTPSLTSIEFIHREGLYLPSVPASEQNKIYFNSDGTNTDTIWLRNTPLPYFWQKQIN